MDLFTRTLQVRIARKNQQGISINQDFKISCKLIRTLDNKPTTSTVEIWNLNQTSLSQIKKGYELSIQAGYQGELHEIYNGLIDDIDKGDSGECDKSVKISCNSQLLTISNIAFNKSYSGIVQIRTIITDICGAIGLPYKIPTQIQGQRKNFVWHGRAIDCLNKILYPLNYTYTNDNGEILIHTDNEPIKKGYIPHITYTSGLIGLPQPKEDSKKVQPYINFSCLFNPAVHLGRLVKVNDTEVKIIELNSDLNSDDGNFQLDCKGIII